MDASILHISLHRTNFLFLVSVVLLCLITCGVLAQSSTVAPTNNTRVTDVATCPSGYQCLNSSDRNVTVELGYNGKVCPGHTPQECYGEDDPRGFVPGPRQYPSIMYQGDTLIVKSADKYNFAVKLYNVSKSGFQSCNFQNASPVISDFTKLPFKVPQRFVEATGIKYFIAKSDNMIIRCEFGLKLEVNVRSREKCLPSPPDNGVCSSKGLCAVEGKFFTFNASCVCDTGYLGSYCGERNSCHAALNPCQNGATCIDNKSGLDDDYNCNCVPGYGGKNCQHDINECESNPCQNGAICLDKLNQYQCLCQPGYFGVNCSSLSDDKCELKPCKNGGTCERAGENRLNYTCTCPSGFTGRNCTENVTISSSAVPYTSVMTTTIVVSTPSMTSLVISVTATPSFATMVASTSSLLAVEPTVTSSDAAPSSSSVVQTSSTMPPSTSSLLPSLSSSSSIQLSSPVPSTSSMLLSTISSVPPSISSLLPSSSLQLSSPVPSTSSLLPTPSSSSLLVQPLSSSPSMLPSSSSSSVPLSTSSMLPTPSSSSSVPPSTSSMLPTPSSVPPSTTSAGPTLSSSTQEVPSSTLLSSQIIPSTPLSSTVMSSSVYPTMPTPPPTTIPPIKDQTCKNKPCNNGTCLDVRDQVYGLNFTCQCPKPTYGPRCSTDFTLHFPRFSSSSYLVHKPIAFSAGFNKIVITFKTTASNGLLFYSTHSKYKDFIQLYITEGKLEYRFDPGDYLCVITSNVTVNTGNIVTAVVTYDSRNKQGSLQVDSNPKQIKTSLGKMVGIGLYNDWYVGGLPPGKSIGKNDGGQATPTLVGCIKDIELNGDQIRFTEATDWNDISECDTPCKGTHKPCQNSGQCIEDPDDPHAYECNCTAGFQGKHCENPSVCSGDPCSKGGLCIMDKSVANVGRVCLCPFGRGGIECQDEISIRTPTFTMVYNYSSFIEYQVPTLSGPFFEISLQFKIDPNTTSWNNALLMFSGQNEYQGKGDDFIALGINNSKVLLQYNLGSGIANIESDLINTTQEWHTLTAGRNGKEGYLYLDNQDVKRGSSPGQLTGLNLYSPLYIGGVPDLSELPTDVLFKRGFEGSISNGAVKFGVSQPAIQLLTSQSNFSSSSSQWLVKAGRNIGDAKSYNGCNTQPCQNGGTCSQKGAAIVCSCVNGWRGMYCASQEIPCVNYNPCAVNSTCREMNNKAVCDCPLGKTGATCSDAISIQRPHFKDNSYMAFSQTALSIRLIANIVIKFIPYNENGLLFYVAHKITTQKRDFLSASLHNGFVQYRYDLGSGVDPKQSQQNITMNTEHTVTLTRNQQTGTLQVDDEAAISVRSPGSAVALDASSNFYLGGVPQLSLVNPSAIADVRSLKDFVGCVTSVTINGVPLKLTETGAIEGRNIANCPAAKASDSNLA